MTFGVFRVSGKLNQQKQIQHGDVLCPSWACEGPCRPVGVRKDVFHSRTMYARDSSVKKVMSNSNRVSRSFAQLSHSALGTFGNGVVNGMTNNLVFKTPLVPVEVLSPAVTKFVAAQTKALKRREARNLRARRCA